MNTNEFLPNIRCPHCKKAFVTPIGGFGREKYNSRQKQCNFCKKDFVVEIFVNVSKEAIADIFLSGVGNDIKYFRKKRKETYEEKLKLLQLLRDYQRSELEEIEYLATQSGGSC